MSRVVLIAVFIGGGTIAFIAGIIGYAYSSTGQAVAAEQENIRAEGRATTIAELEAKIPKLSAGENAANMYRAGFDLMVEPTEDEARLLPIVGEYEAASRSDPYPPEVLRAMEKFLRENEKAIALFMQAATYEQCVFIEDYSDGPAIELPHLSKLRGAVRRLYIEAEYSSQMGARDRAARAIVAAISVPRALDHEHLLISQLVRIALDGVNAVSFARVVGSTSLTNDQLLEVGELLDIDLARECFVRGLEGETVIFDDLVHSMVADPKRFAQVAPDLDYEELVDIRSLPLLSLWVAINRSDGLRFMNESIKVLSLPYPDMMVRAQEVEALTEEFSSFSKLVAIICPSINRAVEAHVRDATHLELMRAIVAIELYRNQADALPSALDENVFGIYETAPMDLFSGKDLIYKQSGSGYTMYSVGSNLRDDGGVDLGTSKEQRENGDWFLTVAR